MQSTVDQFFQGYVKAFNDSLGDRVEVEAIRSHFSDCFVAAGPDGVNCGENNDAFAQTLQQGDDFYISIGTKAMAVRGVDTTPIDDTHHMAKVNYRAAYEKKTGGDHRHRFLCHVYPGEARRLI